MEKRGAGDGDRTRDMQLGRLPLCQLSYSRPAIAGVATKSLARPPAGRRAADRKPAGLLMDLLPRPSRGAAGLLP